MRRNRPNPLNLSRARQMRHYSTPAEQTLWQHLRNQKLNNHKFRRQHPLDGYILDFYCPHSQLVIELDGEVHKTKKDYDTDRTIWLEVSGLKVLRFQNKEVLTNIEKVLTTIHQHCQTRSPSPRYAGERGQG